MIGLAEPEKGKRKKDTLYRTVEVRMWGDEKFRALSPLPPSGQSLWLYLLTCPFTGPIPGLFKAGRAAMAEDLNWELEDFDKAFQEVFDLGLAEADFKARLVWLPKAIRYNKPASPNVVKSWRREIDLLPECELKSRALQAIMVSLEELGPSYASDFSAVLGKKPFTKPSAKTLAIPALKSSGTPMPKTLRNQEQEQEQDNKALSEPVADAPVLTDPGQEETENSKPDDDVERAAAEYTRIAEKAGWPKPKKWTPERKRKLKLRLDDVGGLQEWIAEIERAARSPVLTGENNRGWRASIDFFLQPSSFLKLIEGNYDDKRQRPGSAPPRAPQDQEKGWANQLTLWKRGSWNGFWGPEPLTPGCSIPADFVKRWEISAAQMAHFNQSHPTEAHHG